MNLHSIAKKATTHWANSNAEAGYQPGEGESFPMQAIPVWVSWVANGTCVSVAGRRWDLSWCRGRDASTAGGGEGGRYQCACCGPSAGPMWMLQAVGGICLGPLVSRLGCVGGEQRRKGWSLEVAAAQLGDFRFLK